MMKLNRILAVITTILCIALGAATVSAQGTVAVSVRNGTADPAQCQPSSINIFLNRTSGLLKFCTASNTWTALNKAGGASTASTMTIGTGTQRYPLDVYGTGSQIHVSDSDADSGGYITGKTAFGLFLSAGASHNGTSFVARNASAQTLQLVGGSAFQVTSDTGLTPGNTFTPTNILSVASGGTVISQGIGTFTVTGTTVAPTALTATVVAGAGVDAGTHSYKVTFVTAGGETSAGTVSNTATTAGGNLQVNLTAIPLGNVYVTSRKIYRTTAGNAVTGPWLLQSTIANNSATTLSDNTADAALTTTAPSVNTTVDARTTIANDGTVTLTGPITSATNLAINSSTTTFQIGASNRIQINNSNIQPSSHNSYGLGTSSLAFQNGYIATSIQAGAVKTLVETSATGFVTIAIPNSGGCAGKAVYTVFAADATNTQIVSGELFFSAVATSGGTVTAATLSDQHNLNPVTSGTLTNTMTQTTGANLLTLQANATSSLTQTTLEVRYRIELQAGVCTVTGL